MPYKQQGDMRPTPAFLTAFWAGMAAPTGLYAATPLYMAYAAPQMVQTSFFFVGRQISEAMQKVENDGRAADSA